MPTKAGPSEPLTILFTCVGRRVELMQAFRAAAKRLGQPLRIAATDGDLTAPALSCADEPLLMPRISEPDYIPKLLEAVRRLGAKALIPTIDTDLQTLADHREAFLDAGCVPLVGGPDVIRICRNKLLTFQFLDQHGIDTPRTYSGEELRRATQTPAFPLFCKPLAGSASQRIHRINDKNDLDYFLGLYDDLIVQEFVEGKEYTLDAYVGLTGEVRCVVPRLRWQVRTGEVVKGVVVKDRDIMEAGRRVGEALGPSLRGLITLQCMVTKEHRIRFIEINPRFGGGAPLGIAAGAEYPLWLLQELRGETPNIAFDGFTHGMCMLRFDWSVFLPLGEDLEPKLAPPLRAFPKFE